MIKIIVTLTVYAFVALVLNDIDQTKQENKELEYRIDEIEEKYEERKQALAFVVNTDSLGVSDDVREDHNASAE